MVVYSSGPDGVDDRGAKDDLAADAGSDPDLVTAAAWAPELSLATALLAAFAPGTNASAHTALGLAKFMGISAADVAMASAPVQRPAANALQLTDRLCFADNVYGTSVWRVLEIRVRTSDRLCWALCEWARE
jgi:hypothetical protein